MLRLVQNACGKSPVRRLAGEPRSAFRIFVHRSTEDLFLTDAHQ